ncbi:MAG TPA: hypothetical protein VE842_03850, partial [Pyrinomonadaceae bacterium]|nr:hypothetical protein [Pyrinomonadaceae bacterium]
MTRIPVNQAAFTGALVLAQKASERGDLAGAQKLLLELIAQGTDAAASERGVLARTALAEIYEGLGQ